MLVAVSAPVGLAVACAAIGGLPDVPPLLGGDAATVSDSSRTPPVDGGGPRTDGARDAGHDARRNADGNVGSDAGADAPAVQGDSGGLCASGATRCVGKDMETCGADGTWGAATACSIGSNCAGGYCPASCVTVVTSMKQWTNDTDASVLINVQMVGGGGGGGISGGAGGSSAVIYETKFIDDVYIGAGGPSWGDGIKSYAGQSLGPGYTITAYAGGGGGGCADCVVAGGGGGSGYFGGGGGAHAGTASGGSDAGGAGADNGATNGASQMGGNGGTIGSGPVAKGGNAGNGGSGESGGGGGGFGGGGGGGNGAGGSNGADGTSADGGAGGRGATGIIAAHPCMNMCSIGDYSALGVAGQVAGVMGQVGGGGNGGCVFLSYVSRTGVCF